jgi:hypothetical protein
VSDLPIPDPWWVTLINLIKKFIEDNWSGLAMILWGYEEKKIEGAKQAQKTAELDKALAEDEVKIRRIYSGKSDTDILKEFGAKPPSDSDSD